VSELRKILGYINALNQGRRLAGDKVAQVCGVCPICAALGIGKVVAMAVI
jgi:hypothetical protein